MNADELSSAAPDVEMLTASKTVQPTGQQDKEPDKHHKLGFKILLFALLLVLIYSTYGLVLSHDYLFADDYFYLGSTLTDKNWFSSLFATTALQGRPLNGLLLGASLAEFRCLNDFAYLHIVAILSSSLLAYLIYGLSHQSGWTRVQSVCLALALLSLPPFQVILAWSVTAFYVLAMIFSIASIRITISTKLPNAFLRTFLATLSLLLALAIYQPAAMFYWVFAAIHLTDTSLSPKQRWSSLSRIFLTFGLATLLDLAIFEISKMYYGTAALLPQRSHLTTHIGQKALWFINGPLVDALNFNRLLPNPKLAAISMLCISLGLWVHFRYYSMNAKSPNTKSSLRFTLVAVLVAFAFIPLSYTPNLSIADNFHSYRTQLGLSALVLFFAFVAARALVNKIFASRANRILTPAAISACSISLICAHLHIKDFFVDPQLSELKSVRSQLNGELGEARKAKPVLLTREQTLAPYIRYDEFGLPSFSCSWVKDPGIFLIKRELLSK